MVIESWEDGAMIWIHLEFQGNIISKIDYSNRIK